MNPFELAVRTVGPAVTRDPRFARVFSQVDRALATLSSGRLQGGWIPDLEGPPLVLETIDGHSGHLRSTPLPCLRRDPAFVVFAARGGRGLWPDWYHDLMNHSLAHVWFEGQRARCEARVAEGAERAALLRAVGEPWASAGGHAHAVVLAPVGGLASRAPASH